MEKSDAPKKDPSMLAQFQYERVALDHYPTPARCTEALLTALGDDFAGYHGWEPACGNGAISNVVKDHFQSFISTDIALYDGFQPDGFLDFLDCSIDDVAAFSPDGIRPDFILTNPPYGKNAEAFTRKALELVEPEQGVVVMLCRHEWDTAKGRSDLFDHPAFRYKITMRFRPRWIEGTSGAPRFNYSWYYWDWSKPMALKPELIYVG